MEGVDCMFKSKWRKKYEQAMELIERWRAFHETQAEMTSGHQYKTHFVCYNQKRKV